jgi:hypothetical protein
MEAQERRKEEITRRPLYGKMSQQTYAVCFLTTLVYDLPRDILSNLVRKEGEGPTNHEEDSTDVTTTPRPESKAESADGPKSCSLCGVTFYTIDDQRSHVRSDLHGYNLKQRMRGVTAVTENEFEKLVGGMAYVRDYRIMLIGYRS